MGTASRSAIIVQSDEGLQSFQWTITNANDIGQPFELPQYADVTWMVEGNFDTTGVIKFRGSLSADGTGTYYDLHNPGYTTAQLSAAGVVATIERTRWLRPEATTAPANLSVTVTVFIRKTKVIA